MNPYRRDKVASAIRQVVGYTLIHGIKDPRVSPLTTVTRVEISADLLLARVFLTVSGGGTEEARTMAGIRHAAGFVQRKVASALDMRQCPELRFEIDERVKGVKEVMALLDENKRKEPHLYLDEDEEGQEETGAPPLPETDQEKSS